MERRSRICLLCFKFNIQPEDKEFYVYKIKIKNPNWEVPKGLNELTYELRKKI